MYRLQIVTPEKIIFDEEVVSLIVSGEEGYLGILTNHAPLITPLKEGALIICDKKKKRFYYKVSSGFLDVSANKVSIIVETIESSDPIDVGTEGVV